MSSAQAWPHLDLFLYVSGNSMSCARALHTLRDVLGDFPAAAIRLQVLDVDDDIAAAERHRVLFTPTLILKERSGRLTRILGDLSNARVLFELIRAAGLEPA
jgi:hypothetical protein